jgi:hypothetical protein
VNCFWPDFLVFINFGTLIDAVSPGHADANALVVEKEGDTAMTGEAGMCAHIT